MCLINLQACIRTASTPHSTSGRGTFGHRSATRAYKDRGITRPSVRAGGGDEAQQHNINHRLRHHGCWRESGCACNNEDRLVELELPPGVILRTEGHNSRAQSPGMTDTTTDGACLGTWGDKGRA